MMNEKKSVEIGIEKINELSFYLKSLSEYEGNIELGGNLQVGIAVKFNADIKSEQFFFYLKVIYQLDGNETILEQEQEIVFRVKNIQHVVKDTKEGLDVEDNFLTMLASVAIGTARGGLATNTKGSRLANFPLPIVNPKDIISNM
ncbi:hypothetical protein EYV94_10745 [Puteibacter caeruleilacunae]|nr:hypothetical protein EYV94_10745 [Puteibacter caeruleilacunae]